MTSDIKNRIINIIYLLNMIYKASFTIAAFISASQATSEQEAPPPLRSLYEVDQRMEMILNNASKYHANLDFTDF